MHGGETVTITVFPVGVCLPRTFCIPKGEALLTAVVKEVWKMFPSAVHKLLFYRVNTAEMLAIEAGTAEAQSYLVQDRCVSNLQPITEDSWLLAHNDTTPAPAPAPAAEGTSGGSSSWSAYGDAVDFQALLAPFFSTPLSDLQMELLRTSDAFADIRALLLAGRYNWMHLSRLLVRLECVLGDATRAKFVETTGYVLDGAVGRHSWQGAGTSIMRAIRDARVLCAKLGHTEQLRWEWEVSQAIHAAVSAPTVLRAEACEPIPGRPHLSALLSPLYPMTLADAALHLPYDTDNDNENDGGDVDGHRAASAERDVLAYTAALCTLAAIDAFAQVGWAHGDIKPSNIMLSGQAGCVLIDFGTAQRLGDTFHEGSAYSLDQAGTASIDYDLVCLGATLAWLQYEMPVMHTTRASLLGRVQAAVSSSSSSSSFSAKPPPPTAATIIRCLDVGAHGHAPRDRSLVRTIAEELEAAAKAAGLSPLLTVAQVWPTAVPAPAAANTIGSARCT